MKLSSLYFWRRPSRNGTAHLRDLQQVARSAVDEAIGANARIYTSTDRWFHLPMRLREDGNDVKNPFKQHPWVYAAITAKAENLAQVPFQIRSATIGDSDDPGDPVGPDHPLQAVLDDPNPEMDGADLIELFSVFLDYKGEFFLLGTTRDGKAMDRGGVPEMLWVLPPDKMEEQVGDNGLVERWKLRQTKTEVYPAHAVLHVKLPNPENPTRGQAPIDAAWARIAADHKSEIYTSSLMDNAGDPGGVVTSEAMLDPKKDVPAIRKQWEDRHQGPDKSGRVAVLWGGMTYQQFQTNARDMAFPELHASTIDAILAVIRVPKIILSKIEDVNRNTALVSKRILWQEALIPRTTRFERAFDRTFIRPLQSRVRSNGKVIPGIGGRQRLMGRFDLSGVEALKEDFSEKLGQAKELKELGYGLNEINERLDLGMEDVLYGEEPLEAANKVPVSLLYEMPGAFISSGAGGQAGEAEGTGRSFQTISRRAWRARFHESYSRAFYHPAENEVLGGVRRYFSKMRTLQVVQIERWLRDHPGRSARASIDDMLTVAERAALEKRGVRLPATSPLTQAELEQLLLAERIYGEEMEAAIAGRVSRVSVAALEQLGRELGGFSVITPDPEVSWIRRGTARRIAQMVKLAQADRALVRQAIIRGIVGGDLTDVRGVQGSVSKYFTSMRQHRALRIARTETGMLASGMRHEGMAKEGVETHEWVTARDENVRPDDEPRPVGEGNHRALDGVKRPIGKGDDSLFPNGLRYPLDPSSGKAAEVVNCRCVAVAAD